MHRRDKLKVIVASSLFILLFGYYMLFGKDKILMVMAAVSIVTWLGFTYWINSKEY